MAWIQTNEGYQSVLDSLVWGGKYCFVHRSGNWFYVTHRRGGYLIRATQSIGNAVSLAKHLDSRDDIDWLALAERSRHYRKTGKGINKADVQHVLDISQKFLDDCVKRSMGIG